MNQPLIDVQVRHDQNGGVHVVDVGQKRRICKINSDCSTAEAERIGQLIADLLRNHGHNDDTTGLYDEEYLEDA